MTHLLILTGSLSGKRYALNRDEVSIGSEAGNDLVLPDAYVARRHVKLMRTGTVYRLFVHHSMPPTAVNGNPIMKAELIHGDQIQIGSVDVRYVTENPASPHPDNSLTALEHSQGPDYASPRRANAVAAAPIAALPPNTAPTSPPPLGFKRVRWRARAAAAVVLIVIIAVSVVVFSGSGATSTQPTKKEEAANKEPPKFDATAVESGAPALAALPIGVGPSGLKAGAKVLRTAKFASHQAAVDAARPGDAVIFDSADTKPVVVSRRLEDIQFLSGSAKWELKADLVDCQFFFHELTECTQTSGRMERCAFFRCAHKQTHLNHADGVSFYGDESRPLSPEKNPDGGRKPQLRLTGFVRGVLVFKPFAGSQTAERRFDMDWDAAVEILATDPIGNGTGSYFLSPVIRGQRAWTPHRIARGTGVTYAHCASDGGLWADPVLEVNQGTDCVVLCTNFGAQVDAAEAQYTALPRKLKYADHDEFGHDQPGPAFRGAAICIQGQRNRVVAHGDATKTWTIGRRQTLPGLHYADGIVAADPFLRQLVTTTGGVSVNLAEPKQVSIMARGKDGFDFHVPEGAAKYPLDGADLIRPVFVPLKDMRVSAGEFDKYKLADLTGKPTAEIEAALARDQAVFLGSGTYEMTKPLSSGLVVGGGIDRTILKFPAGGDCCRRGCKGIVNCTVAGGTFGCNLQAGNAPATAPPPLFLRTRFRDQKNAGINLLHARFTTVQDCEFVGCKAGITVGGDTSTKALKQPKAKAALDNANILHLNIANCTFRTIGGRALDLRPDQQKGGQVAVHNCLFEDVSGSAIHVAGGQTHLVQLCQMRRCGISEPVLNVQSNGVLALSHLQIEGPSAKPAAAALSLNGTGAVSHCTITGYTSTLLSQDVVVVDHVVADGDISVPKDSLVCRCRFKNLGQPGGASVAAAKGFSDVTGQAATPALDGTPPPDVVGMKVRSLGKNQRRVEWQPVEDGESGIVQYAIFAGDREVGRTALRYEPTGDGDGPLVKPIVAAIFVDSNPNSLYSVKAINGAGLMSGGGLATPRRFGPARGLFFGKDGAEITWVDFALDKMKRLQVVDPEGKRTPAAQLGRNGAPHAVLFETGRLLETHSLNPEANPK